ncbi:MAG TPA: GyrI-like domain-containing protein [Actinomycetota bacterium]|jgi:effector-binding domain-containing protein|nr:GyrI-like domain-containing protein [Actinomycetota bacterium]
MSYEIEVKEVPDQLVASVHRRASMSTVGKEVPEAFHELAEAVGPVGFGAGMPGVEYLSEVGPDTEWDMEIFMPVAERFEPPEGMRVRTLAGRKFAATVHRGPYAECGAAYEALTSWIADSQYRMAGPPRELYLNDPNEAGQDEALTEILFPIR